jgi:outer membrane protein TolC
MVIETAAIDNRPDIEIIRREVTAIAEEVNLKQPWTYSNIKVGTSAEREPEGFTVAGPLIELELPIYNYGQGQAIKYNALLDQAQKRLLAKAINGCSEVREFFKKVNIFRSQVVDYDIKILPDFAKQVSSAQAHYNVMALGIYDLLDVKDKELQASIEQLHAIKNYEKARIELFHAAGGSFASVRTRQ